MSVLFTVPVPPSGVVLHVLQIRNRTAFLARELGLAAGASEDARGFLDNIVREWASALDEDDDVAQLVGAELDVLKREVPLPEDTTMELVLFATGAERVLTLSRLRHSRSLILFLHAEVLSRVLTLPDEPDDSGQNGAPASPDSTARRAAPKPATSPPPSPAEASPATLWNQLIVSLNVVAEKQERTVAASERLCRSVVAFDAINKLAEDLVQCDMLGDYAYSKLRWEAVEELLGRRLRTPFPVYLESEDEAFAS